ncbi:MAG: Uma2 family endonuclease [Spirochaetaceae bacterium]|nr:Uma2 family endonuclease [Spirochaetaceae bacterium]
MATGRTVQAPVAMPAPRTRTEQPPPTAADFPGCKPVRLPREELDDCEMRLEYWDTATETAWICDPVSSYHEGPAHGLAALVRLIAAVRGAPVKCLGSTDLTERDAAGEPRLIMQADQSVYLHPARARLPVPVLTIGEHDFPDVVLEVDHTTDARRRKLPQYEAWGFPEVWIEVSDADAPSRPRRRRSGLTIHLLEDGAYRQAAASRAFPGWTAAEIHAALNEQTFSAQTSAALERVGAVLGEREGTGPDDDPLLGAQRRRSRAEGHAEGRTAGRAEGRAEGLAALARALLAARGIEVSPGFPGVPGFAELPDHVIAEAATACVSEADFRERLRSR